VSGETFLEIIPIGKIQEFLFDSRDPSRNMEPIPADARISSQMSRCTKLGDWRALPFEESLLLVQFLIALGGIYFFQGRSGNVHRIGRLLIKCNSFAESPNLVQQTGLYSPSLLISCSVTAVRTRRPSGLKTALETRSVWPWKLGKWPVSVQSAGDGASWSDGDERTSLLSNYRANCVENL
jgi:hypothetical protein